MYKSVLALEYCNLWGVAGVQGRVPSLMDSVVEIDVSRSYLFSFVFDVLSMGHPA